MGFAFFLGVSLLTAAPHYALFAVCCRRVAVPARAWTPLAVAAAWVATELTRAHARRRSVGARGLLAGGLPRRHPGRRSGRRLCRRLSDRGGERGARRGSGSRADAGAPPAAAPSWWRRSSPRRSHTARYLPRPVGHRSAWPVVQGNLDLGSQWQEDFYGRNLDTYLRLTRAMRCARRRRRSSSGRKARSRSSWRTSGCTGSRSARSSGPLGAELLTGGPRAVRAASGPPAYYNAAYLIAPDGTVPRATTRSSSCRSRSTSRSPARHPAAALRARARVHARRRRRALRHAGREGGRRHLQRGDVRRARPRQVAAGATLLVALANDSWIADARFAEQALDMAVFRAVEERRDLVRASTWGPSAVVDAHGRIVARTPVATATALVATVQARGGRTPYGRSRGRVRDRVRRRRPSWDACGAAPERPPPRRPRSIRDTPRR